MNWQSIALISAAVWLVAETIYYRLFKRHS
jgi:hypothetical protein